MKLLNSVMEDTADTAEAMAVAIAEAMAVDTVEVMVDTEEDMVDIAEDMAGIEEDMVDTEVDTVGVRKLANIFPK